MARPITRWLNVLKPHAQPHPQRTFISRPDFMGRVKPGSADVPVGHQFKV
ncbi:MAG: hypothetical protein PHG55_13130 [Verrucomicrobiota bacterium]|nr:hypothetical protein [Verrucomicrobiota bacterium]